MDTVLKNFIKQQLYDELSKVEIIPYNDSIWFIDREEKYWYFELEKNGNLYWRYAFFNDFFKVFSMERNQFEPIISEWVEDVLNHKVVTTVRRSSDAWGKVEDVLNHKVSTTEPMQELLKPSVDEILNHKVSTTAFVICTFQARMEEILNHKVSTTIPVNLGMGQRVKYVLNCKVSTSMARRLDYLDKVEGALNYKVNKSSSLSYQPDLVINGVLNTDPVDSTRDWKVGNILNENPTE